MHYRYFQLSRPAGKRTLWTLRKVSIRISPFMPRRLTWTDSLRLLWIFCFMTRYIISLSPWDGMCQSGLACVDWAGLSGSIHYAESIMLVISWNALSYIRMLRPLLPTPLENSMIKIQYFYLIGGFYIFKLPRFLRFNSLNHVHVSATWFILTFDLIYTYFDVSALNDFEKHCDEMRNAYDE